MREGMFAGGEISEESWQSTRGGLMLGVFADWPYNWFNRSR